MVLVNFTSDYAVVVIFTYVLSYNIHNCTYVHTYKGLSMFLCNAHNHDYNTYFNFILLTTVAMQAANKNFARNELSSDINNWLPCIDVILLTSCQTIFIDEATYVRT